VDALIKKQLVKKGAEAILYRGSFLGFDVIIKERIPKKYRSAKMDEYVRRFRTIHEAKLLISARKAGIPTPFVYFVNKEKSLIVMDYIKGDLVKELVHQMSKEERENVFYKIGSLIAKLHVNGMVHGDLTTSNMIMLNNTVYFIDFGLGGYTVELEDRGVDLHLMFRALESTHYQVYAECKSLIERGYESVAGKDLAFKVLERVKEIRRRGRYVSGKITY